MAATVGCDNDDLDIELEPELTSDVGSAVPQSSSHAGEQSPRVSRPEPRRSGCWNWGCLLLVVGLIAAYVIGQSSGRHEVTDGREAVSPVVPVQQTGGYQSGGEQTPPDWSTPAPEALARVFLRMNPQEVFNAGAAAAMRSGGLQSPEGNQQGEAAVLDVMLRAAAAEGMSEEQFRAGYDRYSRDRAYAEEVDRISQAIAISRRTQ